MRRKIGGPTGGCGGRPGVRWVTGLAGLDPSPGPRLCSTASPDSVCPRCLEANRAMLCEPVARRSRETAGAPLGCLTRGLARTLRVPGGRRRGGGWSSAKSRRRGGSCSRSRPAPGGFAGGGPRPDGGGMLAECRGTFGAGHHKPGSFLWPASPSSWLAPICQTDLRARPRGPLKRRPYRRSRRATRPPGPQALPARRW